MRKRGKKTPEVSIIVLTLNEEKNIQSCLNALFNQKTKYAYQVYLIDSSSDDRTLEIARSFNVNITKIERKQFHHGGTRNLGAEMAQGEFLVYLAGDACPVDNRWLDSLIDPLVNNRKLAAVYGRQIPRLECDPINRFRLSWNYRDQPIHKDRSSINLYGHRTYFFSTVNCAIRKEHWKAVKFREDIPIFEDTAFAKEVIDRGYAIQYNTDAVVTHSHNLGVLHLFKRYRSMGYVQTRLRFLDDLGTSFANEGLQYLKSGVRYLFDQNQPMWIAAFVVQTFFGYVGLTYGRYLARAGRSL